MDYFCEVKNALRVRHRELDSEIRDTIEAAKAELIRVGVDVDSDKILIQRCIELYCKAHFDFDNSSARFLEAFEKMRDALSLSADYRADKKTEE